MLGVDFLFVLGCILIHRRDRANFRIKGIEKKAT